MPAWHQRRDHHLRADAQRFSHEVLGEFCSGLDDDAAELMTQRERPRQRLWPVAFENVQVGAAYSARADRNQRGFLRNVRPFYRADHRRCTGAGEGGNSNGAVAHGIFHVVL
jgi:hypothetical protein